MIKYNVTNIKGENPMWSRLFIIGGDGGDSTSLSIPLESSPVAMQLLGKKPVLAISRQIDADLRNIDLYPLQIDDGVLTFTFSRPLANGEWMHIPTEFYYE
jgi:hypothetical protein